MAKLELLVTEDTNPNFNTVPNENPLQSKSTALTRADVGRLAKGLGAGYIAKQTVQSSASLYTEVTGDSTLEQGVNNAFNFGGQLLLLGANTGTAGAFIGKVYFDGRTVQAKQRKKQIESRNNAILTGVSASKSNRNGGAK